MARTLLRIAMRFSCSDVFRRVPTAAGAVGEQAEHGAGLRLHDEEARHPGDAELDVPAVSIQQARVLAIQEVVSRLEVVLSPFEDLKRLPFEHADGAGGKRRLEDRELGGGGEGVPPSGLWVGGDGTPVRLPDQIDAAPEATLRVDVGDHDHGA